MEVVLERTEHPYDLGLDDDQGFGEVDRLAVQLAGRGRGLRGGRLAGCAPLSHGSARGGIGRRDEQLALALALFETTLEVGLLVLLLCFVLRFELPPRPRFGALQLNSARGILLLGQ